MSSLQRISFSFSVMCITPCSSERQLNATDINRRRKRTKPLWYVSGSQTGGEREGGGRGAGGQRAHSASMLCLVLLPTIDASFSIESPQHLTVRFS